MSALEPETAEQPDAEGVCLDDPVPGQGWWLEHPLGRVGLSILLALFVFVLVVWNLPASEVRSRLRPEAKPVVYALGIDQNWGVFSPNPSTTSLAVEADVTFADGSVERFRFPDGNSVFGAYREYRWRKFERRVRLDDYRRLWRSTAEWIVQQYDDREVVEVVLIRIFSKTPEPGSGDERVWESVEYYTYTVEDDR